MHTTLKYFSVLLLFGLLATGCGDKKKDSNGEGEDDADNGENTEQTDNGDAANAADDEAANVASATEEVCTCLEGADSGEAADACIEKIAAKYAEKGYDFESDFGEKVEDKANQTCPEAMEGV